MLTELITRCRKIVEESEIGDQAEFVVGVPGLIFPGAVWAKGRCELDACIGPGGEAALCGIQCAPAAWDITFCRGPVGYLAGSAPAGIKCAADKGQPGGRTDPGVEFSKE